jgi:hypothetical protein
VLGSRRAVREQPVCLCEFLEPVQPPPPGGRRARMPVSARRYREGALRITERSGRVDPTPQRNAPTNRMISSAPPQIRGHPLQNHRREHRRPRRHLTPDRPVAPARGHAAAPNVPSLRESRRSGASSHEHRAPRASMPVTESVGISLIATGKEHAPARARRRRGRAHRRQRDRRRSARTGDSFLANESSGRFGLGPLLQRGSDSGAGPADR